MNMTPPVLSARDLRRAYLVAGAPVEAVRGLTLDVHPGEWVAVVGPSGCGKSTLLNLLGAIDRPTSGQLLIRGRDVAAMDDKEATRFRLTGIGFVFQRFYLMPTLSAAENVELPMAEAKMPRVEREARAKELLTYVGLGARTDHRPFQLSGGEQQRVAVARALANRPRIVLADEPTASVDAAHQQQVIDLIRRTCEEERVSLLLVTHAMEVAGQFARVDRLDQINRVARDNAAASPGT